MAHEERDDGRFISEDRGALRGEAAGQDVGRRESRGPKAPPVAHPADLAGGGEDAPTYYDRPVIKEPVWIWTVPAYFFVGGLAGCAAALGEVAALDGDPALRPLVRQCRLTGTAGTVLGAGLLTADLGRPERFLYMLRVFRPSSPMSMGAWILAVAGATGTGATLLTGGGRRSSRGADVLGLAAGVSGLMLAGYTGVLVSCTAVPVWRAGRRVLPALFLASGVASTGALLEVLPSRNLRERRMVRRVAVLGKVAELACARWYERAADRVPRVGRPLHAGLSGSLWRAATGLTLAGLALSVLPGRRRWKEAAAGALGLTGALTLRFAVQRAGKTSARDPRATFEQQRAVVPARPAEAAPRTASPEAATVSAGSPRA